MSAVRLLSLATANPRVELAQGAALELAVHLSGARGTRSRAMTRLYEDSGVRRRFVSFDEHDDRLYTDPDGEPRDPGTAERIARHVRSGQDMALRACAGAIERAGSKTGPVTHLVTATCTGFSNPGVESGLVRGLGLRPDVARVHVGYMGCHAAVNALRVARALAVADSGARVLVCCYETCSVHYQFAGPQGSMIANALFGDGAGACLVSQSDDRGLASVEGTSSMMLDGSEGLMGWTVGDHGFEMRLSPRVPDVIGERLSAWLPAWCEPDSVASWAIHPGGPKVVESVLRAIGRSPDAGDVSRGILRDFGNMSSPTVLFILERLIAAGTVGPCAMMAFGPGLTCEGALISLPSR